MASDYKSFMNSERQIAEAVAELAMWKVASDEHRAGRINQLVKKYIREGIEKSDPFFLNNMICMLKNNQATPEDYLERRN